MNFSSRCQPAAGVEKRAAFREQAAKVAAPESGRWAWAWMIREHEMPCPGLCFPCNHLLKNKSASRIRDRSESRDYSLCVPLASDRITYRISCVQTAPSYVSGTDRIHRRHPMLAPSRRRMGRAKQRSWNGAADQITNCSSLKPGTLRPCRRCLERRQFR